MLSGVIENDLNKYVLHGVLPQVPFAEKFAKD